MIYHYGKHCQWQVLKHCHLYGIFWNTVTYMAGFEELPPIWHVLETLPMACFWNTATYMAGFETLPPILKCCHIYGRFWNTAFYMAGIEILPSIWQVLKHYHLYGRFWNTTTYMSAFKTLPPIWKVLKDCHLLYMAWFERLPPIWKVLKDCNLYGRFLKTATDIAGSGYLSGKLIDPSTGSGPLGHRWADAGRTMGTTPLRNSGVTNIKINKKPGNKKPGNKIPYNKNCQTQ